MAYAKTSTMGGITASGPECRKPSPPAASLQRRFSVEAAKARKPQKTRAWAHPAVRRRRTLDWPSTSLKKMPTRLHGWSKRFSGPPRWMNESLSHTSQAKTARAPTR